VVRFHLLLFEPYLGKTINALADPPKPFHKTISPEGEIRAAPQVPQVAAAECETHPGILPSLQKPREVLEWRTSEQCNVNQYS
jgi:hypothetical protein